MREGGLLSWVIFDSMMVLWEAILEIAETIIWFLVL